MRFAALLLLVLVPHVVLAQSDRISGPAESPNGRISILKVTVPNSKLITWTLVNPPPDANPDVPTKDPLFFFSSGYAGEYRFVVSVTTVDEAGDVGQIVITHILKNGQPQGQPTNPTSPTPPPVTPTVPTPTPTPNPNVPPGVAAWVAMTVQTTVTADPNRAETAKVLARLYVNWITTGSKITDPREFVKGQDALNKIILTQRGVLQAWDPFFRALSAKLASMDLNTIQDHLFIWSNIANGLER